MESYYILFPSFYFIQQNTARAFKKKAKAPEE